MIGKRVFHFLRRKYGVVERYSGDDGGDDTYYYVRFDGENKAVRVNSMYLSIVE